MTAWSDENGIRRVAYDSVLLCAALALSYLESLIPLPFPGMKPGLANIAVTVAAYRYSVRDAALVSLCRVTLMFILFGGGASLLFSLLGALCSLLMLCATKYTERPRLSFIGISALCALSHNIGQLAAAVIISGTPSLSYAPYLMLTSALCGSANGVILGALPRKIFIKPKNNTLS